MKQILFKISVIILSPVFSLCSYSQTRSYGIGDVCPDILVKHIINYKTNETKISDYKGKLLILDFWATWCAPCLSMIAISDSFQRRFESKIQILPVTEEDSVTVARFFKNMGKFKQMNMPSVTGDKMLRTFFPHEEIPHYVWIDRNGVIAAITGAKELTADNIENFITGQHPPLAVKYDLEKTIDENQPMFVVGNEIKKNSGIQFEKIENTSLLFHSVITKYIEGFPCESNIKDNKLECKNNSIGGLFRFAAGRGKLINLFLNGTIWEVTNPAMKDLNDSSALAMDKLSKSRQWMKDGSFCYELKFPSTLDDKKYDIMLADLNNYFGSLYNIECKMEKRKVRCLALAELNKNNSFASDNPVEGYACDPYHLKLTNQSMTLLADALAINLDLYPPIVNETKYNGKIDVELKCDLQDLNSVNGALQKYGLELQEITQDREMVIIKDKPRK